MVSEPHILFERIDIFEHGIMLHGSLTGVRTMMRAFWVPESVDAAALRGTAQDNPNLGVSLDTH
jgi:hypothetical protein